MSVRPAFLKFSNGVDGQKESLRDKGHGAFTTSRGVFLIRPISNYETQERDVIDPETGQSTADLLAAFKQQKKYIQSLEEMIIKLKVECEKHDHHEADSEGLQLIHQLYRLFSVPEESTDSEPDANPEEQSSTPSGRWVCDGNSCRFAP